VLLRVIEELKDGRYHCKLFSRFGLNLEAKQAGVLGYRCLRMSASATSLPLRLRLLDKKTDQPMDAVVLHVRQSDFQDESKPEVLITRNGLAVSKYPYQKAAFVRVMVGNVQKAQIPVLLLDEQPVVCTLDPIADEHADRRAFLIERRGRWERRIVESLGTARVRVKYLNEMKDTAPDVLLAEARKKYQAFTEDLANLRAWHKELRNADAKLDLSGGETLLAALQRRGEDLQRYIDGLDQALKEANSEKTKALKALYQRALLLEKEADCQEALNIYDKILAESPKETKVREDRDRLAKAWQLRGPEHKEARDFVYEVWPKLDLKGVQDNLEKARQFLQVCKKAGDKYTPLKLLRSSPAHATELKRRLEQVLRIDSEDARAERKRLENLGRSFEALIQEVVAYVGKE
jgi:tetratricopeptide (TPR) repeat protein